MKDSQKLRIVLGLDSRGRFLAGQCVAADEDEENAIRDVMYAQRFKLGRAETKQAANIASKLIDGKIFEPTRGKVPVVRKEVYRELLKVLKVWDPYKNMPLPGNVRGAITIGDTVLCQDKEQGNDCVWRESKVVGLSKDRKSLIVRWANNPALKPITINRKAVALLPVKF